jgi:hypothetical protein
MIIIGNYTVQVEEVDDLIEFSIWTKIMGCLGIFTAICAFAFGLAIPLSPLSDCITWAFNISAIIFVASMGAFLATAASLKSGCGVKVSYREGSTSLYSSAYVFSGDAAKDAEKVKELIDEYKQRATISWKRDVEKSNDEKLKREKCHCQYKIVMSMLEEEKK